MSRVCLLYPVAMLLLPVSGGEYGSLVIYIHIGVRSALLVSINRAMRRPQNVRRVTGTGSHAFFIFEFNTNNHSVRRIYGYLSKVQLLYGMLYDRTYGYASFVCRQSCSI